MELPDGSTGLDAAAAIGPKLAEQAVLVRSNGHVRDLRLPLEDGEEIQILTTRDTSDADALAVLRHSSAHLLAEAVRRLYPGVTGVGPLAPGQLDEFRRMEPSAGDLVLGSYHPLGSCQMGTDPRGSVVGLDHQTHDVPGLFIVDGSTVRGPLGVNPQLTIMAVAARAADQISPLLG